MGNRGIFVPCDTYSRAMVVSGAVEYSMTTMPMAFDPSQPGNPTLIHERKERSLLKQAALLCFSLKPAEARVISKEQLRRGNRGH